MDTRLMTKRHARSDSILPHKRESSGYVAVRQWSDGEQYPDYGTFASTPAMCNDMAHPHIIPTDEELMKDKLAPIVGYIKVTINIMERIAI